MPAKRFRFQPPPANQKTRSETFRSQRPLRKALSALRVVSFYSNTVKLPGGTAPTAVRVVVVVWARTAPALSSKEVLSHLRPRVFLNPRVAVSEFPPVAT